MSDIQNKGFTVDDVKVSVEDLAATVDGGSTVAAISCSMMTNNDGTPVLIAGDTVPLVYVEPLGIAHLDLVTMPLTTTLQITALTPNTGGNNGGYLIAL